jgi:Flp pilus assembly protein TadD
MHGTKLQAPSIITTLVIGLLGVSAASLPGCQSQPPVVSIREDADWHFSRGEFGEAAEKYAEITARWPEDWQAQYKLGLSLTELDRLSEANRALEVAYSLRPRDPDVADALAEVMYRQDEETRLFTFLRADAEASQSVRSQMRLAKYAEKVSDLDGAKVALETAIEFDDGKTVDPYLQCAELYERLGDREQAVRRLKQAYGINPKDPRVLAKLESFGEVPGPTLALPPGR